MFLFKNEKSLTYFIILCVLLPMFSLGVTYKCSTIHQQKTSDDSTQEVMKVTVKELKENSTAFVNKQVVVQGMLKNEGKNYFKDLRLFLFDKKQNKVAVQPWLPVSIPPMPDKSKTVRPPVLSDFLNKQVKLSGTFKGNANDKLTVKHILFVKNASIIE